MLVGGFWLIFKSADLFVDGAIGVADHFGIPKMLTGVVLVAFATTAPEFTVSLLAAIQGHPEIALGNAVGSVICDDTIAIGLAALFAASPILINKRILLTSGIFLLAVDLLAFGFALDGKVARLEGAVLLLILLGYFVSVYLGAKKRKGSSPPSADDDAPAVHGHTGKKHTPKKLALLLGAGFVGIVLASEILIHSATTICYAFGIPEVIVGMTVIAIGTSLPEISTCITAARRGEGELAAGDIIGADILNILWIIGASSLANPIHVERKLILFAFPAMLVVVGSMLGMMRSGYKLTKINGTVLLSLYAVYAVLNIVFFVF